MNKIAIIVVGGLLLSGVFFVILTQKPKKSPLKVEVIPTKTVSPQIQFKTYTNASGFSFQYSKSFTLSEKEAVNESTYAWVELTDPKSKDVITIKLVDSTLAKIDDWFSPLNKKGIKGEIKNVKLADLDGRQFTDKESKLTTLAIDKGGVLISISGNSPLIHQQIVSSFIFNQTAQATTGISSDPGSGGEDIIFEGEEVVE